MIVTAGNKRRHLKGGEVMELPGVDKALQLITCYGGIDGAHHKQWLIDQVVRALADNYDAWVAEWQKGEDGPNTYEWDTGVAP